MMDSPRILVTGATGKLGPHVLEALKAKGWRLRVATPDAVEQNDQVEWVETDFTKAVDYAALVRGCRYVVHLAAELAKIESMRVVNVEATKRLAIAAENGDVEIFVYTSSVGAYGMLPLAVIDEESPVLDVSRDDSTGFLCPRYLYDYCVTKLQGEHALAGVRKRVRYIVPRPSNIATKDDIAEVLNWPRKVALWRSHRWIHHIYVKDMAAAIVHLLEYAIATPGLGADRLEIYNCSNDNEPRNRFGHLFRRLAKAGGEKFFAPPAFLTRALDVWKDRLKFKYFGGNLPPGLSNYSPAKLLKTGFRHPFGIINVQDEVIAEIVAWKSGKK